MPNTLPGSRRRRAVQRLLDVLETLMGTLDRLLSVRQDGRIYDAIKDVGDAVTDLLEEL